MTHSVHRDGSPQTICGMSQCDAVSRAYGARHSLCERMRELDVKHLAAYCSDTVQGPVQLSTVHAPPNMVLLTKKRFAQLCQQSRADGSPSNPPTSSTQPWATPQSAQTCRSRCQRVRQCRRRPPRLLPATLRLPHPSRQRRSCGGSWHWWCCRAPACGARPGGGLPELLASD